MRRGELDAKFPMRLEVAAVAAVAAIAATAAYIRRLRAELAARDAYG